MKSKRILSLLLTVVMVFTMLPITIFATETNSDIANSNDSTVQWSGAANYNDANNQVTSIQSMTASNMTEMKWAYPLNDTAIAGGAYYAGSTIIVGDYLYATGGGKLHKVNINTGEGTTINNCAGVTISYYDYLCYADGVIIVSTENKLEAFAMDGASLGSVEGTYGYYHPLQYHDGYVICNGFIYKLDKADSSVTFTQVGANAIGGDAFNWSSGVFLNDLFYVASKTTVYAVDYKTNTVVDSFIFDEARTATYNVQAGLAYDKTTGRLFWGTYSYNSHIHSIKIDNSEGETKGKLLAASYISEDAQQKSVATPIVYNGRVYLAGQQGRICVLNASDLSKVYDYVTLGGGKVQGTPILSTAGGRTRIYAQCANGHLYMFTDNGESGTAIKLAETANYTNVRFPYAGFEQYAMDAKGNIYCYNESGYLFCFGVSKCEIPVITTDLSTDRVKYAVGAQASPLTVEASVSEGAGELSYQWQSSADASVWTDISGETTNNYTPSTEVAGTSYYRCIITNTNDGNTATATSSAAYVLTKILSANTTLNVMVSNSNSPTGGTRTEAELGEDGVLYVKNRTTKVTNLWLGPVDEGTVTELEVIQGAGTNAPKKYNVSNSDTYTSRYYRNSYTLPIVAKATVTAEDGITEKEYYIVVSSGEAGKYITSASITSESEYFKKDTGVSFTQPDQTAALKVSVDSTIGTGEIQTPQWTWTSSDVKVATVDENGVVKSVGGGEATITASYQNVSASVKVTNAADDSSGGSSDSSTEESDSNVYISVKVSNGKTYLSKTSYAMKEGETAYSLLVRTGLNVKSTDEHQFGGVYVEAIEGLGEFDEGKTSGWMYRVNGDFIDYSSSLYELSEGDYVEWLYTRELGDDVGGGRSPAKEEKESESGKSVTLTPSATADKEGKASAKVSANEVTSAVKASSSDNSVQAIVVEPKIKGEATKISVEIPKAAVSNIAKNSNLDLTVSTDIAEVTISNEGLDEVNGNLTLATEIKNDAVKVDVAVNGSSQSDILGGITVTIPKDKISENAVLVLVNEDGTESIIKKSVESKDGIKAILDGSAIVKVVENSKTYTDTEGHWGENAISFVSSREIFSGTGKGFEPDSNMTRAMVVTTLFRLEDAIPAGKHSFDDVPHDTWYTDAVRWASLNGIVNGTGKNFEPDENVTREQLCAIIFRYAKHIGMDTDASASIDKFADNTEVSSWAKEAIVWATDSGIITGKPGNKLDPQGYATRAEVAVIYQRMINLMIK